MTVVLRAWLLGTLDMLCSLTWGTGKQGITGVQKFKTSRGNIMRLPLSSQKEEKEEGEGAEGGEGEGDEEAADSWECLLKSV